LEECPISQKLVRASPGFLHCNSACHYCKAGHLELILIDAQFRGGFERLLAIPMSLVPLGQRQCLVRQKGNQIPWGPYNCLVLPCNQSWERRERPLNGRNTPFRPPAQTSAVVVVRHLPPAAVPQVMHGMSDSVQPSSPGRGVQRSSPVLLFASRHSPDGKFSRTNFHLLHMFQLLPPT
jgi:hypothetical protein